MLSPNILEPNKHGGQQNITDLEATEYGLSQESLEMRHCSIMLIRCDETKDDKKMKKKIKQVMEN